MKRPRGANEMGGSDDRAQTDMVKRSQPSQLLRKLRNAQRHRQAQIARPQGSTGNVRTTPAAEQQPDALSASQWSRRGVLLALVPLSIVGMVSLFVMGFVGSREIVSFLVGREYVPTTLSRNEQDTTAQVPAETQTPVIVPELSASSNVAPPTDAKIAEAPEAETVDAPPPAAQPEPVATPEPATTPEPVATAETETVTAPPAAADTEPESTPAPNAAEDTVTPETPTVIAQTDPVKLPPETLETGTLPPTAVETENEPPQAVEAQNEPPQAVEVQNEPPQAVETQNEPPKAVETQNEPPQAVEEATPIETAAVDDLIPPSQDADVPPALHEELLAAEAETPEPVITRDTSVDTTVIAETPVAEDAAPEAAVPAEQSPLAEVRLAETPSAEAPTAEAPVAETPAQQPAAIEPDGGTVVTPAAAPTPKTKVNTAIEVATATNPKEEEEPLTRRDNDDLSDELQRRQNTQPATDDTVAAVTTAETPQVPAPQQTVPTQEVAALETPAEAAETVENTEPDTAAQANQLIGEGHSLLAAGDVVQARQLFSRSLATGSAEAALALGRSFDPKHLSGIQNANAAADPVTARKWYEEWYRRSVEQGSISPKVRLDRLLQAMSSN